MTKVTEDREQRDGKISAAVALEHGLTAPEYERIIGILGRVPTYVELGIFSVMWSEHCSYKNSITEIKKLPRTGERLLVDAGEENAGLVDIGDGLAVVFKIESHNHPSAVEPYQGAATGVGGIMRDIFTMGARPIAVLNSLRFGNPPHPRTQFLMRGIVKGIGDYGNSFGVPTVGGEIYFDDCYNENPLVNVMAVGIVEKQHVARAIANGPGNSVLIVGSSTGRDGIHGATFASEDLSDASEAKRPSVQVGDPFTEKLLLEATLEAIRTGHVVGIQDMGAGGITCSTSEMSAKGNCGMVIDVETVPMREPSMTPYEVMLSESQERMLLVIRPEHEKQISEVFSKWDLSCTRIGVVTESGKLQIKHQGNIVADIPAISLVLGGDAPIYTREKHESAHLAELRSFDLESIPESPDYERAFRTLLGSPNIRSREWVFEQYDSMVRTNTMVQAHGDAGVVRIKGTNKALSMKTDCNSRYAYLNPYKGGAIAVAESARNVVCTGARPIAVTNCLNFGNPYKPDVFWQFSEAIRGIGDACRALNTPVTGGNVSFYNESPSGAIFPTPVIGMLGLIESLSKIMTADFKHAGHRILLLGKTIGQIGGSEYLRIIHNLTAGDAPDLDLVIENRLQNMCLELIRQRLIESAHDVSDGGLAIAVAESCILNKSRALGANISIESKYRDDNLLFGEDQSRIVVSSRSDNVRIILALASEHDVEVTEIGEVTSENLRINSRITISTEEMKAIYYKQLISSV